MFFSLNLRYNLNVMKVSHLIMFLLSVITIGCKNDDNGSNSSNTAPGVFNLIGVTDNAIQVDPFPNFNWEASTDPDGDSVTYDFYLDKNPDPSTLVAADLGSPSYSAFEQLNFLSQYFWKVIAKDGNGGVTSSTIFSFTTRKLRLPNIPVPTSMVFDARFSQSAAAFQNKLWIIGGVVDGVGYDDDVWSTSNGIDWSPVTNSAPFTPRGDQATVAFNNRLWVIGGVFNTSENDVWSSGDGLDWVEVTSAAPFSERHGHSALVFNNKIWVIGGYDISTNTFYNDVWSSADGVTWAQSTANAAFSARSHHEAVVFKDKILVIGGFTINDATSNDIWSSIDGITWVEETSSAAFDPRNRHTVTAYNDQLVLIGGFNSINSLSDIWTSVDGVNWEEIDNPGPFPALNSHTATVISNKLWVIAGASVNGAATNGVWILD